MAWTPEDTALAGLLEALRRAQYTFVAVTPETHRRVLARAAHAGARTLRDIFGWSMPFARSMLAPEIFALAAAAGVLRERADGTMQSRVRVATLGRLLLVHSAYPTEATDAVFFGPDTYRFAALLAREANGPYARVVDVGCGTGAGGLALAERAERVVLADINHRALDFARVNARAASAGHAEVLRSDVLAGVDGEIDLVVSNPPYLVDGAARTYRDGGGGLGTELAVRIAREALERLRPGGQLILYSGAPVVAGRDVLLSALRPVLEDAGARFEYAEIDPDVFGEELEREAYREVERIAAVALVARRPG